MPDAAERLPHYREVVIGEDSYHDAAVVRQLAGSTDVTRSWSRGHTPVSVELRGGGVVKSLAQFDKHNASQESFYAFMEECRSKGVTRPSSYASVFHDKFFTPKVSFTVNKYFRQEFAGAWQDAIVTGKVMQPLRKYDLNSAYLWAGSRGLPLLSQGIDYSERITSKGLYLLEIVPKLDAPFPYNRCSYVTAEAEDVELYGLTVLHVHGGVTWRKLTSGQEILDAAMQFSFWKQIGRSYWGRWASRRGVRCKTFDFFGNPRKCWEMGNPVQNFVWAQIIVNRVKRRLYETNVRKVHVFVDSIITPDKLSINRDIGGWKLEAEYPYGLDIVGTGCYGEPGGPLIKHAGMVLDG